MPARRPAVRTDWSRPLLRWYAGAARDLPWRRPGTDPWAVLVSEVMLQQTPIARVLPAYREWLRRWPTAPALAAAPVGEAVRQWGRLGYPRRAVRLHATAGICVDRYGGRPPARVEQLRTLPGVGEYTARAVACFGFGQRQPVVDTNVRRVLARAVLGRPGPGPATTAADLALAESLLPARTAGAVGCAAALMELGALVCTSRGPRCPVCPLAGSCRLRSTGPTGPAGPAGATDPVPARRRPRYAGSDRQVRGRLLAILRDDDGPVPAERLAAAAAEPAQRGRALAGLVADGLAVAGPDGYRLPG